MAESSAWKEEEPLEAGEPGGGRVASDEFGEVGRDQAV